MSDILKTAESLNADVSRLNIERSKLEGMLESAKTNYENAVKAYLEKYGVELTEENLQEEYNRVYAQTKGAMLDLQEKIEGIKRGDYKKDVEEVEFDLEPNVEPIREEPKPEKKRGRKPKAKKEEVIDTEKILEEAKEVPTVESEKQKNSDEVELPKGPLNFNLSGFGEPVAPSVEPTVPTTPVAPTQNKSEDKPKVARKPISADMISQAVASTDATKQHPVTLGGGSESDDEVDLSSLGFGNKPPVQTPVAPKVQTPVAPKVETPVAPKVETPVAPFSFGDFGNFGVESESKPTETKEEQSSIPTFGDFGGFGGFGGLDDAKPIDSVEPVSKNKGADTPSFGDFSGFGGFGDLTKEEKKPESASPKSSNDDLMSSFGNLGEIDFNALMNNPPKFGE